MSHHHVHMSHHHTKRLRKRRAPAATRVCHTRLKDVTSSCAYVTSSYKTSEERPRTCSHTRLTHAFISYMKKMSHHHVHMSHHQQPHVFTTRVWMCHANRGMRPVRDRKKCKHRENNTHAHTHTHTQRMMEHRLV